MLLSRGVPKGSRRTSELQGECLDPNWLPGVGQRWLRQGYNTRSLRKPAVVKEPVGKGTCSKEVVHKVDNLLLRDLRGKVCYCFFLQALPNEGVSDVSDVVLRGREDKPWQQNQQGMGVTEQAPHAEGAEGCMSSGEHHLSAPIVPTAFATYKTKEMALQGTGQMVNLQASSTTHGCGGEGGPQC